MGSHQSTAAELDERVDRLKLPASPIAMARTAFNTLVARLFAPIDNSSIVFFRIAFGLIMLWEVNRYLTYGWVASIFIDPVYHFPYHGFEWVTPWPGNWMYVHFYALAALAILITLGLWYRISAALFFVGFTYVFLLEKANYLNHLYLVCLISFLMIFVPAHRSFSLDARRRPELRSTTAPTWALVLLAGQFTFLYVYGGIAKINGDWLRGEPMRSWLLDDTDLPIIGRWFTEEWMVYFITYSGLLLDLFIVPFLLWSKTRWFAVVALILFHELNSELFSIGVFPTFAMAAIVLFLPPSLPRRIVSAFQHNYQKRRRRTRAANSVTEASEQNIVPFMERPLIQRATVAFVFVYLGIQLLVPMRHFLYSGNTAWTDQDDRFAWRMMLHSKVGSADFIVSDPETGQTWEVAPTDYLTSQQLGHVDDQPDMILQFSHFLADEWRKDGYDNVEVRVNSSVSLNGRPYVPLVYPDVDLASENVAVMPADWITSLDEQLRLAEQQEQEQAQN